MFGDYDDPDRYNVLLFELLSIALRQDHDNIGSTVGYNEIVTFESVGFPSITRVLQHTICEPRLIMIYCSLLRDFTVGICFHFVSNLMLHIDPNRFGCWAHFTSKLVDLKYFELHPFG